MICCAILAFWLAKVAELADAPDLGSGTERCGGSSPPFRTIVSEQWAVGSGQWAVGSVTRILLTLLRKCLAYLY